MKHFSKRRFKMLVTPRPKYVSGEVHVSAAPDLYVEENGRRKLIKLDFNQSEPDPQFVKILLKVMHEAGASEKLGVGPKDVVYLDVSRQTQHAGTKLGGRIKKDIDAACENIAAMWPGIRQD